MNTATRTRTFTLPDLGEGLTEAEVVRWLVTVGDEIAVDQPVAEVETAKALVEVPSPFAGRVAVLHGAEGSTIDVGRPLISVEEADSDDADSGSGNVLIGYGTAKDGSSGRRRHPRAVPTPGAPAITAVRRPVASPLVRQLARRAGVDVQALTGTGRGGLVTRADVEAAIDAPAATESSRTGLSVARRVPMSGFRKASAATLSRSRSEIPEATVWVDVDFTALLALRAATPSGPGLLAYLARFTVAALRAFPELGGEVDGEAPDLVQFDGVNLGVAVQTDRGLVVPTVGGAHRLTTAELDAEIRRVTAAAREGRSTAVELSRGTFTLNNYGSFGVDGSAAIIHHPQVAMLGFGRVIDRPWVVDGEVTPRKVGQMSFVFDHRVCDGGTAAAFMRIVADAVENPASAIANL